MRRAVVVLLAACGGAPATVPDAEGPVDAAAPDARVAPDPNSAPCAAPAPLGSLAPLTSGDATIDEGADATHYEIDYQGRVADTQMLTLVFKEGSGAFAGGFAPGTYTITGDDTAVATCGLCTLLTTSYYDPGHSQYLMAQSGSFTFTQIDRTADGRVVGSADGVGLERVIYKNMMWIPEDGCTTTIDHLSFDVPLKAGPFFP